MGRQRVRYPEEKCAIVRRLQTLLCLSLYFKNSEFYPRDKIMARLKSGTQVFCSADKKKKKLIQKTRKPQSFLFLFSLMPWVIYSKMSPVKKICYKKHNENEKC